MIDGQGLSAYYKLIANNTDGSDVPAFPKMPWYFWAIVYLCMIVAVPLYGTINWWGHTDRNALHRGVPLSTKKLAAASREIDCDKIKELATLKKTTVGSMVSAFLSVALYRYFERNGNKFGKQPDGPIPKSITIGMPMSLRPPHKDLTTIKFYNKIAAMPYEFRII